MALSGQYASNASLDLNQQGKQSGLTIGGGTERGMPGFLASKLSGTTEAVPQFTAGYWALVAAGVLAAFMLYKRG